jgi:hypothetical protein
MRRLTATRKQSLPLNSESLTYWYFRLNGFFTIPNFVVHPDRGSKQRTEVDVFDLFFVASIDMPLKKDRTGNGMTQENSFGMCGKNTRTPKMTFVLRFSQ